MKHSKENEIAWNTTPLRLIPKQDIRTDMWKIDSLFGKILSSLNPNLSLVRRLVVSGASVSNEETYIVCNDLLEHSVSVALGWVIDIGVV